MQRVYKIIKISLYSLLLGIGLPICAMMEEGVIYNDDSHIINPDSTTVAAPLESEQVPETKSWRGKAADALKNITKKKQVNDNPLPVTGPLESKESPATNPQVATPEKKSWWGKATGAWDKATGALKDALNPDTEKSKVNDNPLPGTDANKTTSQSNPEFEEISLDIDLGGNKTPSDLPIQPEELVIQPQENIVDNTKQLDLIDVYLNNLQQQIKGDFNSIDNNHSIKRDLLQCFHEIKIIRQQYAISLDANDYDLFIAKKESAKALDMALEEYRLSIEGFVGSVTKIKNDLKRVLELYGNNVLTDIYNNIATMQNIIDRGKKENISPESTKQFATADVSARANIKKLLKDKIGEYKSYYNDVQNLFDPGSEQYMESEKAQGLIAYTVQADSFDNLITMCKKLEEGKNRINNTQLRMKDFIVSEDKRIENIDQPKIELKDPIVVNAPNPYKHVSDNKVYTIEQMRELYEEYKNWSAWSFNINTAIAYSASVLMNANMEKAIFHTELNQQDLEELSNYFSIFMRKWDLVKKQLSGVIEKLEKEKEDLRKQINAFDNYFGTLELCKKDTYIGFENYHARAKKELGKIKDNITEAKKRINEGTVYPEGKPHLAKQYHDIVVGLDWVYDLLRGLKQYKDEIETGFTNGKKTFVRNGIVSESEKVLLDLSPHNNINEIIDKTIKNISNDVIIDEPVNLSTYLEKLEETQIKLLITYSDPKIVEEILKRHKKILAHSKQYWNTIKKLHPEYVSYVISLEPHIRLAWDNIALVESALKGEQPASEDNKKLYRDLMPKIELDIEKLSLDKVDKGFSDSSEKIKAPVVIDQGSERLSPEAGPVGQFESYTNVDMVKKSHAGFQKKLALLNEYYSQCREDASLENNFSQYQTYIHPLKQQLDELAKNIGHVGLALKSEVPDSEENQKLYRDLMPRIGLGIDNVTKGFRNPEAHFPKFDNVGVGDGGYSTSSDSSSGEDEEQDTSDESSSGDEIIDKTYTIEQMRALYKEYVQKWLNWNRRLDKKILPPVPQLMGLEPSSEAELEKIIIDTESLDEQTLTNLNAYFRIFMAKWDHIKQQLSNIIANLQQEKSGLNNQINAFDNYLQTMELRHKDNYIGFDSDHDSAQREREKIKSTMSEAKKRIQDGTQYAEGENPNLVEQYTDIVMGLNRVYSLLEELKTYRDNIEKNFTSISNPFDRLYTVTLTEAEKALLDLPLNNNIDDIVDKAIEETSDESSSDDDSKDEQNRISLDMAKPSDRLSDEEDEKIAEELPVQEEKEKSPSTKKGHQQLSRSLPVDSNKARLQKVEDAEVVKFEENPLYKQLRADEAWLQGLLLDKKDVNINQAFSLLQIIFRNNSLYKNQDDSQLKSNFRQLNELNDTIAKDHNLQKRALYNVQPLSFNIDEQPSRQAKPKPRKGNGTPKRKFQVIEDFNKKLNQKNEVVKAAQPVLSDNVPLEGVKAPQAKDDQGSVKQGKPKPFSFGRSDSLPALVDKLIKLRKFLAAQHKKYNNGKNKAFCCEISQTQAKANELYKIWQMGREDKEARVNMDEAKASLAELQKRYAEIEIKAEKLKEVQVSMNKINLKARVDSARDEVEEEDELELQTLIQGLKKDQQYFANVAQNDNNKTGIRAAAKNKLNRITSVINSISPQGNELGWAMRGVEAVFRQDIEGLKKDKTMMEKQIAKSSKPVEIVQDSLPEVIETQFSDGDITEDDTEKVPDNKTYGDLVMLETQPDAVPMQNKKQEQTNSATIDGNPHDVNDVNIDDLIKELLTKPLDQIADYANFKTMESESQDEFTKLECANACTELALLKQIIETNGKFTKDTLGTAFGARLKNLKKNKNWLEQMRATKMVAAKSNKLPLPFTPRTKKSSMNKTGRSITAISLPLLNKLSAYGEYFERSNIVAKKNQELNGKSSEVAAHCQKALDLINKIDYKNQTSIDATLKELQTLQEKVNNYLIGNVFKQMTRKIVEEKLGQGPKNVAKQGLAADSHVFHTKKFVFGGPDEQASKQRFGEEITPKPMAPNILKKVKPTIQDDSDDETDRWKDSYLKSEGSQKKPVGDLNTKLPKMQQPKTDKYEQETPPQEPSWFSKFTGMFKKPVKLELVNVATIKDDEKPLVLKSQKNKPTILKPGDTTPIVVSPLPKTPTVIKPVVYNHIRAPDFYDSSSDTDSDSESSDNENSDNVSLGHSSGSDDDSSESSEEVVNNTPPQSVVPTETKSTVVPKDLTVTQPIQPIQPIIIVPVAPIVQQPKNLIQQPEQKISQAEQRKVIQATQPQLNAAKNVLAQLNTQKTDEALATQLDAHLKSVHDLIQKNVHAQNSLPLQGALSVLNKLVTQGQSKLPSVTVQTTPITIPKVIKKESGQSWWDQIFGDKKQQKPITPNVDPKVPKIDPLKIDAPKIDPILPKLPKTDKDPVDGVKDKDVVKDQPKDTSTEKPVSSKPAAVSGFGIPSLLLKRLGIAGCGAVAVVTTIWGGLRLFNYIKTSELMRNKAALQTLQNNAHKVADGKLSGELFAKAYNKLKRQLTLLSPASKRQLNVYIQEKAYQELAAYITSNCLPCAIKLARVRKLNDQQGILSRIKLGFAQDKLAFQSFFKRAQVA